MKIIFVLFCFATCRDEEKETQNINVVGKMIASVFHRAASVDVVGDGFGGSQVWRLAPGTSRKHYLGERIVFLCKGHSKENRATLNPTTF